MLPETHVNMPGATLRPRFHTNHHQDNTLALLASAIRRTRLMLAQLPATAHRRQTIVELTRLAAALAPETEVQ